MKYKVIAAIMVIIVSAFSFSYGEAQTADHAVGHAVTGQHSHKSSNNNRRFYSLGARTDGCTWDCNCMVVEL
jgi:hypothetical protein